MTSTNMLERLNEEIRRRTRVVRIFPNRARVRVAIEHVFAVQKCRLGPVVRSIDIARATARLGFANLVTNMRRLVWFETRFVLT